MRLIESAEASYNCKGPTMTSLKAPIVTKKQYVLTLGDEGSISLLFRIFFVMKVSYWEAVEALRLTIESDLRMMRTEKSAVIRIEVHISLLPKSQITIMITEYKTELIGLSNVVYVRTCKLATRGETHKLGWWTALSCSLAYSRKYMIHKIPFDRNLSSWELIPLLLHVALFFL